MADLKTNYVDDKLDVTKNQIRKYRQIQNDDGTVSFVDVTEYTQVGTSFGAKDINDTNAAVNDVNGKLQWKKYVVPNTLKDIPSGTYKSETINELISAKEFLIVVGNSYVAYIDNSIGLTNISANVNFPYGENYGYRFAVMINSEGLVQVYTELVGSLVKTLTINRIYYR